MKTNNLYKKIIKKMSSKLMIFSLAISYVLAPVNVSYALENEINKSDCVVYSDSINYGDIISFGNYLQSDTNGDGDVNELDSKEPINWKVLSVADGTILLLSDMIIDAKEFDVSKTYVTWENSELRTWLNGTFFDNAFSANEQLAIVENTIVTKGDALLETEDITTTDKVYVPSFEDVTNYEYGFDYEEYEDSSRMAFNTDYTATKPSMFDGGESDVYWLRNNGQDTGIMTVTIYGGIMYHMQPDNICGIRPMIQLDSDKIELESDVNDSGNGTQNGTQNGNNQTDNTIINLTVKGQENYDYAYQVLEIVNETRTQLGLNALTMDKSLLETAMQRAAEISVYFSHTRPNDEECFSLFRESYACGENIAMGQMTPESVMEDWIESPGHYSNIIDSDFTSIGIGCFMDLDGMYHWVQCFDGNDSITPDITGGNNDSVRIVAAKGKYISEPSHYTVEMLCSDLNKVFSLQNYIDIDLTNFTFASNNTDVADVDANGNITIKSKGVATITATSVDNSALVFTRTFNVNDHSILVHSVEATHTEQGYLLHQCSVCGFSWCDNYTPKLDAGDNTNYNNDIINNTANNNSNAITPGVTNQSANKVQNGLQNTTSSVKKTKKPSKVKIVYAKCTNYNALKVKWKKQKGCYYKVQISTKKNFSKNKKTGTSFGNTRNWFDLKKGKTYYVRVRAFKNEGGKLIYGPWSTVKKVKMKK
ncbi:MAG: hypothetical protein E7265_08445 [Lachnospiraceae bacterium]|nr:hypothetical protein [Lachnospiraceae bacterium]